MDPSAFIREVADRLRRDEARAEQVIHLVFQEVRAHVTKTRVSKVRTRLPPAVRSLWMGVDRYVSAEEPPYQLELFGDVMQRGGFSDSVEAERAIVTVFGVLQDLLDRVTGDGRTTRRIFGRLPPHLEIFWLAAARARTPAVHGRQTGDGRRRRSLPKP